MTALADYKERILQGKLGPKLKAYRLSGKGKHKLTDGLDKHDKSPFKDANLKHWLRVSGGSGQCCICRQEKK